VIKVSTVPESTVSPDVLTEADRFSRDRASWNLTWHEVRGASRELVKVGVEVALGTVVFVVSKGTKLAIGFIAGMMLGVKAVMDLVDVSPRLLEKSAGTTPENTLRSFATGRPYGRGVFDGSCGRAWRCLSPSARDRFGSLERFMEYWTGVLARMQDYAGARLGVGSCSRSTGSWCGWGAVGT
jgi:hypothetical protein